MTYKEKLLELAAAFDRAGMECLASAVRIEAEFSDEPGCRAILSMMKRAAQGAR